MEGKNCMILGQLGSLLGVPFKTRWLETSKSFLPQVTLS